MAAKMNFESILKNGPMILTVIGGILVIIGGSWATIKQSRTEEQLHSKVIENAQLTKENYKYLLGEGSYCYMDLSPNVSMPNTISQFLMVVGEYPLWDVQMAVKDIEKLRDINLPSIPITKRYEKLKEIESVKNIGNIKNDSAIDYGRFTVPDEINSVHYYYRFSARNGFWEQKIRMVRVDNRFEQAYKVYHGEKILKEGVSNKFPRNEKGEIEW